MARGLYRLRDYPSSPREELIAAWLRLAPDAAISHESALELLDLSDVIPGSIHLTVPRARRRLARQPGVTTHTTTRPLEAGDVITREGVRLTAPARTIVDVAESGVAPEQVVRATREAIDRGFTTPARLRAAAGARGRRVRNLIETALGEAPERCRHRDRRVLAARVTPANDELLGPLSYVRSISGIDRTQSVYLEAIGFGIDAVDMVYRRLTSMLRSTDPPLPLAFADAWAIIDRMHRLTGLVEACRGLTDRDEAVLDFLNGSRLVENLRHIYQHPGEELRQTAETRRSIWGHQGWQLARGDGHMVVTISPFGRWIGHFRNPAGADQPPRAPVDRVSLFSPDGGVEIGLTGQWESAVRFGLRLDGALQASERPEADQIMRVRRWLPTPPDATYPRIAQRVT